MKNKTTLNPLFKRKTSNRDAYQAWLESELVRYHNRVGQTEFPSYPDYCDNCVFRLDLTFDRYRIRRRKAQFNLAHDCYDVENDNFLLIYLHVVEALYGKRFSRPHNVMNAPLVISCIDFQGSRNASPDTLGNQNPHIHSVWAVRPDDVATFDEIVTGFKFEKKLKNRVDADAVDFEKYDRSQGSVGNMGSYAIKSLVKSTQAGTSGELLRIYPNSNYSPTLTYSLYHKYPVWPQSVKWRREELGIELATREREREDWEPKDMPRFQTDSISDFLDGEPLLKADADSKAEMLATLSGTNSGPFKMRKAVGEPTIIRGATGNRLILRSDAELQQLAAWL